MSSWLSSLLALSLGLGTLTSQARADEVDSVAAPRLELEAANEQHETAVRIHVASTIIGVAGAGGLLGGMTMALLGIRSSGESTAAFFLLVGGASLSVVNLVLVIVGVSLDVGSASRRRTLRAAHPELVAALVPGPGDAGLGLALRF